MIKFGLIMPEQVDFIFGTCMRKKKQKLQQYLTEAIEEYFRNPQDYTADWDYIFEEETKLEGLQNKIKPNFNFDLTEELVKKINSESLRGIRSKRSHLRYILYVIYFKEIEKNPSLKNI